VHTETIMASSGVFKDLIKQCYIVPNQLVRFRWQFASVEHLGLVTADGEIQLVNQSYLEDSSTTQCVSQALIPVDDYTQLVPISLTMGEKYKAPSTATEYSYRELLHMPIVTPRNKSESENETYSGILNPEKVRHNGYKKVEFMYWMKTAPSIVFLPASKLRTQKERERVRLDLIKPFMFSDISGGMMPVDLLSLAQNNLQLVQDMDLFQESNYIIQGLRSSVHITPVSIITELISKLSYAQRSLKQLQAENGDFQSHIQTRTEMIRNRLEDPMLVNETEAPATETLTAISSLPPEDFLQLDSDLLGMSNLFDTGFVAEEASTPPDFWCQILEVYQTMSSSFQTLSDTSIDSRYYEGMCKDSRNADMLQRMYNEIDKCFGGDRQLFKTKFDEHCFSVYSELLSSTPLKGADTVLPEDVLQETDDVLRNSSIQYFKILMDLKAFLDVALKEPEEQALIISKPPPMTDFLADYVERVDTATFPTKTPDQCLKVETIRIATTYTTMKVCPKRGAPPEPTHRIVTKRIKRTM